MYGVYLDLFRVTGNTYHENLLLDRYRKHVNIQFDKDRAWIDETPWNDADDKGSIRKRYYQNFWAFFSGYLYTMLRTDQVAYTCDQP